MYVDLAGYTVSLAFFGGGMILSDAVGGAISIGIPGERGEKSDACSELVCVVVS